MLPDESSGTMHANDAVAVPHTIMDDGSESMNSLDGPALRRPF
jgi:hypothetical protein